MEDHEDLTDLPMKELAARLGRALAKPWKTKHGRRHGGATYHRGPKLHVWYKDVKDQWARGGSDDLTRLEAVHYLFALEHGYHGTAYELFRESPPPVPPPPQIVEVVLVRNKWDFALWGVTHTTATRVFGRLVSKDPAGFYGDWCDKTAVVKRNATEADLREARAALNRMREKERKAAKEFAAELAKIVDKTRNILKGVGRGG